MTLLPIVSMILMILSLLIKTSIFLLKVVKKLMLMWQSLFNRSSMKEIPLISW
jgi:hypothetical protein